MDEVTPLILASHSPRRQMLLQQAGYQFVVDPPSDDAEDGIHEQEAPEDMVVRLATQKAKSVALKYQNAHILGCDTIAHFQDQVLGKPVDRLDAQRMLETLRGQPHHVLTGICLWHRPSDHQQQRCVRTTLRLDNVSDHQIQQYLDTNKWQGKAGAFGYQDDWDWLHIEQGSASNVVGLPLETLREFLTNR